MKKILIFASFILLSVAARAQTFDTVTVVDPGNFIEAMTIDTAAVQIISRKAGVNRRINFQTAKNWITPDVWLTWLGIDITDTTGISTTYRDYFVTDSGGEVWFVDHLGNAKRLYDPAQMQTISQGNDTIYISGGGFVTVSGDDLGDHTATQNISAAGFDIDDVDTLQFYQASGDKYKVYQRDSTLVISISGLPDEVTISPAGVVFHGEYQFPVTDGTVGQVLKTDGLGSLYWGAPAVGAAGESNVGENIGTGANVYATKIDTALVFRSIVGGDYITATQNISDITLDVDDMAISTVTFSDDTLRITEGGSLYLVEILTSDQTLADNGLTLSGDTVILGGTLNKNTTITTGTFQVVASGNNALGTIRGTATTNGVGVYGSSGSGSGGSFISTSGAGVNGSSSSNVGGIFSRNSSGVASTEDVLTVQRNTTGTAATGIGGSIRFNVENADGDSALAGRVGYKWTDASTNNESTFYVTTAAGVTAVDALEIDHLGQPTLPAYGTWASFQNDTTSRIAALTPTGEVVWRSASTLLGAADGDGIYSAAGTVAPVADMLVKLRTDTTFSIASTTKSGFVDYWNNKTSGDYFRGIFNSKEYWGTQGLMWTEHDSLISTSIESFRAGANLYATSNFEGSRFDASISVYHGGAALPAQRGAVLFNGINSGTTWSYLFPRTTPSTVLNDTTIMVWRGLGGSPATAEPIGFIPLPSGGGSGTDDQTLSVATNDSISIEDGNTIQLPINELQADSISNDTIWVDFEDRYQKIHQYDMTSVTGTVTLILSNPIISGVYTLDFKNLSGSVSIVWPAAVKDVNRVALGTIVYNGPFIRTMYYDGTNYIAPPDELEEIAFVADTITGATKTIDLAYARQGIYDINMAAINAVTLTISNPASPGAYSFHLTDVVGTDAVTWPANFVTMNDVALGTVNYTTGTMITCYYNPKRAKYFCK